MFLQVKFRNKLNFMHAMLSRLPFVSSENSGTPRYESERNAENYDEVFQLLRRIESEPNKQVRIKGSKMVNV